MVESKVYNYLITNHIGKENLIKNKELRKMFNINSDKSMRKVIQNIRENEDYYLIVGSISGKTGGFYICHTKEEIQNTIKNIEHRADQMHIMCDILRKKEIKVLNEQERII